MKLEDLEPVVNQKMAVALSDQAIEQINKSRKYVEKIVSQNVSAYGITTGFGKFKDVPIKAEDAKALQRNLITSHAAGVGKALDRKTCRAMMLLRANALAKGNSGVRVALVQLLLDCLNFGIHPDIPEQGSLGASGDLAPLAHLSLVLIGEGKAELAGNLLSGGEALSQAGLLPMELEAKEGLALTNGTQMMSAILSLTLLEAERLARIADIVGAMSLEAQLGSAKAFDEQIQKARPHPGQIESAANLRKLLADSTIMQSHADCAMVQDAYSFRCMPQVHGASRQAFKHAREVLEIEINSATDNPLIFSDISLSGGNFHGQPLALIGDYMAIALAELASISERRIERLVNPALSNGLPAFLTEYGGLNSGYMVAHYTAAALVSENKSLAHPASVDSIPTSANQEDHVSMGAIAARKARAILENSQRVLSIELLCAAQALDLRTGAENGGTDKLTPGPGIAAAWDLVRKHIAHLGEDRILQNDIEKSSELLCSGALLSAVEKSLGGLF